MTTTEPTDTSQPELDPPGTDRLDRRAVVTASVLVVGMLMVVLDTTIINVAIGLLAQAMQAPLPVIQWVTTGYTLALAAVMPISVWAMGRLGGKRVFLVALTVFVVGSVAAGLAWNVTSLIAFRVLQGLGGGLVVPVAMTLALRASDPSQRGRIMAIMGIPVLIGPASGPILGGWMLDALSWRWIFFINLPIGILSIVLVAVVLRPERPDPAHRLDGVGLLLLSPGIAALIYGLTTGSAGGDFGSIEVLLPTLGGAGLVAAFLQRTARRRVPLLDIRLLRLRPVAAGAIVTMLFAAAYFGSMFLVPLYYQAVRGSSATMSGLLIVPQALATGITLQVASRLIDRVSAVKVIATGIVTAIAGFAAFALALGPATPYWVLIAALTVAGVGVGSTLMPTITTATRWLSDEQMPSGTTLLNVVNQVAVSCGTAATSVVLGSALSSSLPGLIRDGVGDIYRLADPVVRSVAGQLAGAFGTTLLLTIALMTAALLAALLMLPRSRPARGRA